MTAAASPPPRQTVDPVRAALLALSWPAVFLALGLIVLLVWSCSEGVGCLARSAASQLPLAVAAPTIAALYGAGAGGMPLLVVGSITSIAVWGGLGWLLATRMSRNGGSWSKWWKLYLGIAALWSVLLVSMMGLAALRLLG